MPFTDQRTQALAQVLQPEFALMSERVSDALSNASVPTSVKRLRDPETNEHLHIQIGAALASIYMCIGALAPDHMVDDDDQEHADEHEPHTDTPPDALTTFSELTLSVAHLLISARRCGVDMLAMLAPAMALAATTPSEDAATVQAFNECYAQLNTLYNENSTLANHADLFNGDAIFAGFKAATEGDADDEDSENDDEEDGGTYAAYDHDE
jgi:hypothetical protein